ncbi:hypothetical protein TNCV_774061 [Trichonephila clavipes]|nr:hypothetical protein TNCV_774061 [Trichonephila clavipes]
MNKIRKTPATQVHLRKNSLQSVIMCYSPNYGKNILGFVQSSKNIIDADFNGKIVMNNAAPDLTSCEIRNIMKSGSSYLEAHSIGEINIKMDDIEECIDNLN